MMKLKHFGTRLEAGRALRRRPSFWGRCRWRGWRRESVAAVGAGGAGQPADVEGPAVSADGESTVGAAAGVDEALALRMIDGSRRSWGLEMFHLDAGWFLRVGDW